ncbi:non-ribosomal peptide synthetase [Arenibacter lacus]|uniref:non-ribosomal peptide synthetase n=1 Tax=Arenibacter lacus TaxID=2608629 RepID=UPI00123DD61F|nr:non-ribosomal peptide synthetase [Arenibacter lacus]
MGTNETSSYKKLTKSQLSLWIGQKLHPEVPLYNMAHSFEINGAINPEIFSKAFQELINRTDALRTVFSELETSPVQSILPHLTYKLEVLDVSTETEQSIQNWMEHRSRQLFNLSQPLFDSVLLKVSPNRYIWFLNIHHLVTDASSSSILYRAMSSLYRHLQEDTLAAFKEIPSYSNYIDFETERTASQKQSETASYWKQRLANQLGPPKFYGKHPAKTSTRSHRVQLHMGKERMRKLTALAARPDIRAWTKDLTLFHLFTTLLVAYLYRVTENPHISIGIPSHNRSTTVFKQTPGLFIALFPMIFQLEATDSFGKLLERVKLETANYLRYAQPGMSTPSINKSFNVILNFINAQFNDFNGIPMRSEWIHPGHCDPAHHLRCHVMDFDGTGDITMLLDFNESVFDTQLRSQAPMHLLNLMDGLLDNLEHPVGMPSMITEKEETTLLRSQTIKFTSFSSVVHQFKQQVKSKPNKPALYDRNKQYTYREIDQKSNQLATLLLEKGIIKGSRVALYMERSPAYLIALIAVLKSGGTFIPIPSDTPINRVALILQDSESALLLTSKNLVEDNPISTIDIMHLVVDPDNMEANGEKDMIPSLHATDIAYILYTSGSSGKPKGVLISHAALTNYLTWAKGAYALEDHIKMPLFTSIGFDLTITATFLPLITGGELIIYQEMESGPDLSFLDVITDNLVNAIKLTPSHLTLISDMDLAKSNIKLMILGGEDLKTQLVKSVLNSFTNPIKIFNEYGPTEATVGCIVAQYDVSSHTKTIVPIGKPIDNMKAYVLDAYLNLVPNGLVGELFLSGIGLAEGYVNLPNLTLEKFITNPFIKGDKLYSTGDLARWNDSKDLEFLGRKDDQVKLGGVRIELAEVESNLLQHPALKNCAVLLLEEENRLPEKDVVHCTQCGLPSNYPKTDFDESGVCHLCNAFKSYKDKALRYFKTEDELASLLMSNRGKNPTYDCISLLSGGKDSTYVLARLVDMGLKVLAFTLDNGYISEQAKENIRSIITKLGVDHIYGSTDQMNKIFVDSLHRHHNVCNGCFKTIYTLSTKLALEKKVPFIITGLSRGQFFETRLSEELFLDEEVQIATIDDTILQARKLYHQEDDAVKQCLDVTMFQKEDTFERVQFLDFYRYSDVRLEEMLTFLKEKVGWVRPTDTGRSTNCLINQVGIYVHKKQLGYSNYAYPYSWDVRMGHKTRTETLEEINEPINEKEVKRIMNEIGYQDSNTFGMNPKQLVAYYTGSGINNSKDLSDFLKKRLPHHMIPSRFKFMKELPLTVNGKVDKKALKDLDYKQLEMETPFVSPNGEIEELLAGIWQEVLGLKRLGSQDDFIALGGHSLAAIRITARLKDELHLNFPLNKIFELPTISEYAKYIENTLMTLMKE